MAEEIASIVDDGTMRRAVPVVGKGNTQNLTDLKYLHSMDLAIGSGKKSISPRSFWTGCVIQPHSNGCNGTRLSRSTRPSNRCKSSFALYQRAS
jgi:hypothetical protein